MVDKETVTGALNPGGELLRAGCLGAVAEHVGDLGEQVLELL